MASRSGTDLAGTRRAAATLLAIAPLIWACESPEEGRTAGSAEGAPSSGAIDGAPEALRVAIRPFLWYAPLMIARAEGLFEAEGLDVEFVQLRESNADLPMLVRGDLDVTPRPVTAGLLNAIARGAQLRLVADKGVLVPGECDVVALVARPDFLAGLGAGTLDGRRPRMSVSRDATLEFITERALQQLGLDLSDFETVYVPNASRLEALQAGTLVAASMSEPFLTRAIQSGAVQTWIGAGHVMRNHQFSFFAFGEDLLRNRRDVGVRFLTAYLEGVRLLAEGKTPRNLDILQEALGHDRSTLQAMCWPTFRADGSIDTASVDRFQVWALEKGHLDRMLMADEYLDSEFIMRAGERLRARQAGRSEPGPR